MEGLRAVEEARERVAIGDVLLDRVSLRDAASRIEGFLDTGGTHHVVTVNLDFIAIAAKEQRFRAVLNSADLAAADGMPLVWLSRMGARPLPERVAGVELFAECCRIAAARKARVFLLGAAPVVADEAARRLEREYPGLRMVGVASPPFRALSPAEDAQLVASIVAARPDFLFVAFGAPRQDLWIDAHREALGVPVAMGIGCILDVVAGRVRRAPEWLRQAGGEWAYRLAQEPGRLWRRYILDDAPLLARLVIARLRRREMSGAVRP